ncbi:MAG: cation transporter [Gammaproteobacteria bacterium]|nr:cation transporter [Gammaproteobacteria bacterium]
MHAHSIEHYRPDHDFLADSRVAERGTRHVVALTAVMMLVEIVGGVVLGSMALLADGWHMATHVAAFGITLYAYRYARRHADDPRFSFGTGKVATLGGFASAVALATVALVMAVESIMRLFEPRAIRFDEAIVVAVVGLVVNLVCGVLLHRAQDHDGHAHDHNLRAAYVHVLADALTSVLAIAALVAAKLGGWAALDALAGLVGAALILRWAHGLAASSGHTLLDGSADPGICRAVVDAIEADADNRVADVHVWRVGQGCYSAEIALVTHRPRPPDHYKSLLRDIPDLAHVLVEVNPCVGTPCA